MRILIVQSRPELGEMWRRHLVRQNMETTLCDNQICAITYIEAQDLDVILLDLQLCEGAALAIADYAHYRRPHARVIFVTSCAFFSDGSVFDIAANACAFLPAATPPDDLAAIVEHYGLHA